MDRHGHSSNLEELLYLAKKRKESWGSVCRSWSKAIFAINAFCRSLKWELKKRYVWFLSNTAQWPWFYAWNRKYKTFRRNYLIFTVILEFVVANPLQRVHFSNCVMQQNGFHTIAKYPVYTLKKRVLCVLLNHVLWIKPEQKHENMTEILF